jgi:hypothetical protein
MPLGVTLAELRSDLKAETFQSMTPAHTLGMVEIHNNMLARTQRELWNQYVWPHLDYHVDMPLLPGQRYYDFPESMPFENLVAIWYSQPPQWFRMDYGIPMQLYNQYGGETGQSWPPRRWKNVARVDADTGLTEISGKIEVWPVPSQPVTIRLEGQAPLNPLVKDTDRCLIDSTAIVLFAAAELLATYKSEGAAVKLNKAQGYIRRLLARSGANKRPVYAMGQGGASDAPGLPTPYLDYIPMTQG